MTEATFELPEKGEARSSADGKVKTGLSKLKEVVNGKLGQTNFEANAALAGKWYTPSIIATEQTRESASFGTLSTPDEITGVVLPTNGLILIRFLAVFKSSVAEAGEVGLFLGSNQIVAANGVNAGAHTTGTVFRLTYTTGTTEAMTVSGTTTSVVSTGLSVQTLCISAAAGTYAVSAKFKASSGSVTAKERQLHVGVLGV